MSFFEIIAEKWNQIMEKVRPVLCKIGAFFAGFGRVLGIIWKYILQFRKFILTIPVAWGAIYLGLRNLNVLPEVVGINLKTDGTFEVQISRMAAVLCPALVTLLCLLLMFCSKRTLTPWLVSIFTLTIPLLIWVTNVFPA